MVDKLCGFVDGQPYKFVHQLPLVVDISDSSSSPRFQERGVWSTSGSRLEEMFMSSSHAKFYTAINIVGIAPCIVGKSNMYRRSHLNALTRERGLSYFSSNICEDHLIGDLLWKSPVPQSVLHQAQTNGTAAPKTKWKNHGLVLGDLAIQPMSHMNLAEYVSRRVRWLRVRKFTVLLATLVEPGTESFLCSLYGALATTTLPWFNMKLGIPQTWSTFSVLWILSVVCWALIDWTLYLKLHSTDSIDKDVNTPGFVLAKNPKDFLEWVTTWLGRETLAFPIWFWSFFCGTAVMWRGKALWVGWDMKVHEVEVPVEAVYQNGVLDKRKGRKD
jgi:ceramide glucosyltransferase